jgi:AcrR family transcriptional regulator
MGIAERREREREALRTQIVEAARDILSEQGLDALSMRAIAERIEYSPATIYLYFRDKPELIHEVVREGFKRMAACTQAEIDAARADGPLAEYGAMGRAYARFALENTAYFRVMFELPAVAQMDCECPGPEDGVAATDEPSFEPVVQVIQRAVDQGLIVVEDAFRGAVIGWGLVHGLTSLFLSGHLRDAVQSQEQFLALIDGAQKSLYHGWRPEQGGPVLLRSDLPGTETDAASAA